MTLLSVPGIHNLPSSVEKVVQAGFLLRYFNDGLVSAERYRLAFEPMMVPIHLGQQFTITRKGTLSIVQEPTDVAANADITSGLSATETGKEQYSFTMNQYNNLIMTNALSSAVAIVDLYLENAEDLGVNAGQSIDVQARRRLSHAYAGGHTYASADSAATTVTVDNIVGFEFIYSNGGRLATSGSNLHPIKIDGVARNVSAVNKIADDYNNDTMTGELTVNSNISVTTGDSVISNFAPQIILGGTATTSYDLDSADTLTFKHLLYGVAALRSRGVKPFKGNRYMGIFDPMQIAALMVDENFLKLFTGRPDQAEYDLGMVGSIAGLDIYESQRPPNAANPGGTMVRQGFIIGDGVGYEGRFGAMDRWLELMGATSNGALQWSERTAVTLILRNPIDILQQVVANAWSFIGDWTCGTDTLTSLGGSTAYYKRAVCLQTA